MSTRTNTAVAICIGVLLNVGCTTSVYPLIGEPTEVLDLCGTWTRTPEEGHGPTRIVVNGSKASRRYAASVGKKELDLTVMTIGDNYYVNAKLRFDAHEDEGEGGLPTLLLPLNLFARVELHGEELHLFPIDEKSVGRFLSQHKVDFLEPEKCFQVLTVPSNELRELVESDWKTLFTSSPTKYVRKPSKGKE